MTWFVASLRENPELAIFLTLALGFPIGRSASAASASGNVVGTLLAGVLVGQLDIADRPAREGRLLRPVPVRHRLQGRAAVLPRAPEERRAPRRSSPRAVRRQPGRPPSSRRSSWATTRGTAAGLLAGAFTESTVIGTAGNTIARLAASGGREDPAAEQHPGRLRRQLSRRHQLRGLVPLEPGAAAAAGRPEGREPRARGGGARRRREADSRTRSAYREWDVRAFRMTDASPAAGSRRWSGPSRRRVSSSAHPPRRDASTPTPETVLRPATRRRRRATARPAGRGAGRSARRSRTASCSTSRWRRSTSSSRSSEVADRTLAEVAEQHGRGVVLLRLVRAGEEIPFAPGTIAQPRRPAPPRRRRAPTSSAPGRRSATSSGPRARPTSCSSASASFWAASSARSR